MFFKIQIKKNHDNKSLRNQNHHGVVFVFFTIPCRGVHCSDKTELSNWIIWIGLYGSDIWIFGLVLTKTELLVWISDWFWFII